MNTSSTLVRNILIALITVLVLLAITSNFYNPFEKTEMVDISGAPAVGWKKFKDRESGVEFYYPPYLEAQSEDAFYLPTALKDDKGNLIEVTITPIDNSKKDRFIETLELSSTNENLPSSYGKPTTLAAGGKTFYRYYAANAEFYSLFGEKYQIDFVVVFSNLEYPEVDLPRSDVELMLSTVNE